MVNKILCKNTSLSYFLWTQDFLLSFVEKMKAAIPVRFAIIILWDAYRFFSKAICHSIIGLSSREKNLLAFANCLEHVLSFEHLHLHSSLGDLLTHYFSESFWYSCLLDCYSRNFPSYILCSHAIMSILSTLYMRSVCRLKLILSFLL